METIEQLKAEIEILTNEKGHLETRIADLEKENEDLNDKNKDLEDDLEGARNDKKAIYDLLIDLCDDVLRDAQDRTSEARESAKEYVK